MHTRDYRDGFPDHDPWAAFGGQHPANPGVTGDASDDGSEQLGGPTAP